MSKFTSKTVSFIAVMAALGNVLSYVSIQLTPLVPSISLGPVSFSLALDLSHLTTFISSIFGGAYIGGLVGLIGGLVAAFEFGFSKGNILSGIAIPLGKAMTGVAAGFIFKKYHLELKNYLLVVGTLLSYIPEGIFTYVFFSVIYPIIYPVYFDIVNIVAIPIIVKASFEMVFLGLILIGFFGNKNFVKYSKDYFFSTEQ